MDHDSASIAWEIASRNLNYRNAVKLADKTAAEELVIVARAENSRSNLSFNSVVERWGNPKNAASDRSLSFVESGGAFKDIFVRVVSGWAVILRSSGSADTSLKQAVSVDHWNNLFFHLGAHNLASFLGKSALFVVALVNGDLKAFIVVDSVSRNNVLQFVVTTKAVASIGAIIV